MKQQSSRLRTVLTDDARKGIITYRDTAGQTFQKSLSSVRPGFTTDPTIKAMIDQLPLPTPGASGAGDGLNTAAYRFNARQQRIARSICRARADYYLNAKHSFSGTYNYISNPTDRPDQGAFYTTAPPVSNLIKDHLLSLSWRWTASPTLTNEAARRLSCAPTRPSWIATTIRSSA